MDFIVTGRFGHRHADDKNCVFLTWDNWNDYSFRTLFGIFYVDSKGERIDLGAVKIGYIDQQTYDTGLNIGDRFKRLKTSFFSLGQSAEYYETLNSLGPKIRSEILVGLRDIAKNTRLYDKAVIEEVTKVSLFRTVSPSTVTGQFRRLSNGGARSTDYSFKFITPAGITSPRVSLRFDVIPESFPPSNIQVLIGRNGVGKTYLINRMIDSLIRKNYDTSLGVFKFYRKEHENSTFANLISVTFSAFDETEPQIEIRDKTASINYSYIGLKRIQTDRDKIEPPKSTAMLNTEFFKALGACRVVSSKTKLWKDALTTLETDPNFEESEAKALIDIENEEDRRSESNEIFKKLSSGHKIILLTITRLIATLQERSLVLIDEPEAHLHPPLLSAFIRALSDLLAYTNGVAIIATHSPVILQGVPRNCVWRLSRTGSQAKADRLSIESFGENVGILTQEIFGLEVTNSGFYKILEDATKELRSYERVIDRFDNQLGMEAKAIVRSLCQKYIF
nr:AAA family ATPase [Flavobacterium sp. ASV13]